MKSERWENWFQSHVEKLKKWKVPLSILLLGILLLLLPTGKEEVFSESKETEEFAVEQNLEERLEDILQEVEGVGKVRVILTLESGAVRFYQQDVETRGGTEECDTESQTVILSQNGEETPILVKTIYPSYQGAVVVCEGADRASVKLAILQAVSSLTGLSSEHITVIKMKSH